MFVVQTCENVGAILATFVLHSRGALVQSPFASAVGACRLLNLHEYQSKDLMESYGATVQPGRMAATPAEALKIATDLQKECT